MSKHVAAVLGMSVYVCVSISVKTHQKTPQIIGQRMKHQTLYSVLYDCALYSYAQWPCPCWKSVHWNVQMRRQSNAPCSLNGYIMFDSIRSFFGYPEKRVWIHQFSVCKRNMDISRCYVHLNGNSRCSCSTCINMYKWNLLHTLWDKITKRANRNRDLFADLHLRIHHCTDDATIGSNHCHCRCYSASTTWHVVCELCVCARTHMVAPKIWILYIGFDCCNSYCFLEKKNIAAINPSRFDLHHHSPECIATQCNAICQWI